ncbi:flagellar protein FlaG [Maledivibacter halophilus]|uniref:Flagellar protein FlaG n=1 Tax=Maledivibacter halophilus TaxID=36842 RepID=A0A1T5JWK4_9FIRM|nr:flagellar protein FlaG [Maledivibacter halophilus]SKC55781.1 flagellar protein FlaG [Maledivibacter halophilus]
MRIDASISTSSATNLQINNSNAVENKTLEIPYELSKEKSKEISEEGSYGWEQGQSKFSESLFDKSIEQANKELEASNRKIERYVHKITKAIMFKIIDTDTKEVIKEFPPEKIQDMIAKMWELAGLFVDERA